FSKICVAKDPSAKLVRFVDQLGYPPFGLVYRPLALAFDIIVFFIIRIYSNASRNCSVTCRLLLFTADLILSFKAQHIGTKGMDKAFWRLAERCPCFLSNYKYLKLKSFHQIFRQNMHLTLILSKHSPK
ncbi:hypothetical protein H5410_027363, partial [Solanum commersonii]